MKLIQQSATTFPILFLMVSNVDHISGKVGITPTVTISKNGGAFAAPAGTVTEVGSGWYKLAPDAADVGTLGTLVLHMTEATCDPTDMEFSVVAFNPYDAIRMGLTALPNANAAANGGLPTVDAANAVLIQDGTGANQLDLSSGAVVLQAITHTGAVIPTVTAVTNDVGITQAGADKVWASAARTLTGFGTLVADIWAYATRELTAITAVTLADGAITAAKIADGAITAAKFGAGAFNAVWERLTSGLTTIGTIGKLLVDNVDAAISTRLSTAGYTAPANADIAAIKAKTDLLAFTGTDVKATLDGETVTVSTNNDKSGYSLSAAGVQAIWDALTSALTVVGSIGKRLADNVDATIGSRLATAGYTAPDNAGIGTLLTRLTAGRATNLDNLDAAITTRATPAQVNAEVDTALADARLTQLLAASMATPPAAGSLFGELTEDDAGTQRFTQNALEMAPAGGAVLAADVWNYTTRDLTVKTGYSLSAAGIQAIWDAATSALTTVGSIGKRLADNIDAAISTRLLGASYTAPDNASITAIKAKTDQVSFVGGDVVSTLQGEPVTVGTNNDKAGYSLSAAGIAAIWDALISTMTVVGSIGKYINDRLANLDATISSRLSTAGYTTPPTTAQITAHIDANSTKLDVAVSSRLASAAYTAPDNAGIDTLEARLTAGRALNLDNLDAQVSTRLATAGYTAPDNTGISSLNAKLTTPRATNLDNLDAAVSSRSSHSVADIWNALTSGLLTIGSIGKRLSDFVDAAISSRLPISSYVAPDNTGIDALETILTPTRGANLDNLDVQVSTRLPTASYVAPDNAGITSMLSRLGGFTGTGVNNVLGFLRAIMRTDATLPGDVGGTFDATTDALQAIRDRGDSSWGTVPAGVAAAVWNALRSAFIAAGSMGEAMTFLYDKVSRVGGVKFITAVDPVTLQLILADGKDYTVASGLPLLWESDSYDITGATLIQMKMWVKSSHELVLTKDGAIVQNVNPARIRVELTAAETATLIAGVNYEYDVDVTLSNGAKIAFVPISPVKVLPDVN